MGASFAKEYRQLVWFTMCETFSKEFLAWWSLTFDRSQIIYHFYFISYKCCVNYDATSEDFMILEAPVFDATTECSSFKCSPEGEHLLLKVHAEGGMWGGRPILGLGMQVRFMCIMYNSACVSHTYGILCHKQSMWDGVH